VRSLLLAILLVASPVSGVLSPTVSQETPAVFEGGLIDMSSDWGEARACLVWPDQLEVPECFRTEAELDQRRDELGGHGDQASLLACSTSLNLYDLTYYGLPVLTIVGGGGWYNLAGYGFDNRTSSFKVGACDAYFADGTFGSGDWYPTALTRAYVWSPTMTSGWNNRVSSVFYP